MAELDFSALRKLSYRGFETDEARKERDAAIEQGFTVVEDDKENPFLQAPTASQTASEPPQASALSEPLPSSGKAVKRQTEAFTDASGKRNYKALYRAAHDFHRRNAPPVVDREYWKTHTIGEDDTPQSEFDYWNKVDEDHRVTISAFNNDPFLIGLLCAIDDELDREYKAARGKIQEGRRGL